MDMSHRAHPGFVCTTICTMIIVGHAEPDLNRILIDIFSFFCGLGLGLGIGKKKRVILFF